jgi:hypothetical protein
MRRRRGDAFPDAFLLPFTPPPPFSFFLRCRVPEARTRWRAPHRASRACRWAGDTPGTPRRHCVLPLAVRPLPDVPRLPTWSTAASLCMLCFFVLCNRHRFKRVPRWLCRSTLTLLGAPVSIGETSRPGSRSLGGRQDRGPGGLCALPGPGPHVGGTLRELPAFSGMAVSLSRISFRSE